MWRIAVAGLVGYLLPRFLGDSFLTGIAVFVVIVLLFALGGGKGSGKAQEPRSDKTQG